MKLTHYRNTPFEEGEVDEVFKMARVQPGYKHGFKPHGLWVSVDGEYDWKWWCEGEEFHLDRLECPHTVVLVPDHKVLVLSTEVALREFTEQYKCKEQLGIRHVMSMDWPLVATRHAGIIIAPYQWDCRMGEETFWYYPWDCASGCIWRSEAIASITPRPKEVSEKTDDNDAA